MSKRDKKKHTKSEHTNKYANLSKVKSSADKRQESKKD